MVSLKTGAVYRIYYTNWKTNIAPIVFILYQGITKVHAINISAIQMSHADRLKIISIISKLSKVKNSTKYTGRVLFRIFRMYAPQQIGKCYRTYHSSLITKYGLVNYGLNTKEEFNEFELKYQSKEMYQEGSKRLETKTLNLFNQKGAKLGEDHFARTSRDTVINVGDVSNVAPTSSQATTTEGTTETPSNDNYLG